MALLSHIPRDCEGAGVSRATERGRAPRDYAAFIVCELLVILICAVNTIVPVFSFSRVFLRRSERGSLGLSSALVSDSSAPDDGLAFREMDDKQSVAVHTIIAVI